VTPRLHALLAPLVCAALLAAPRVALACSVCSAGREDEAQRAFLWTTIFLSVLPLGMFAGFGVFLWLRVRARRREQVAATAPARVADGIAPTA
jgi:hypothetical protein